VTTPGRELRALFDERSDAMRANDIERVMALYADDVVYFDLVPPLSYSGADALRARGDRAGDARAERHG